MNNTHRPIITYAGDTLLYENLAPGLGKGLSAETVEWKRAYGRSTKLVHLNPLFVPFQLPPSSGQIYENVAEPLGSLLDVPMLHTYWTDCPDIETYRGGVKEAISAWLTQVRCSPSGEWLLVLVEGEKRGKALLRTNLLDKLKNDFAQRQTERCVWVSDQARPDSRAGDSLSGLFHRIRQLLLSSYAKSLTRFEEAMRAQREKRNEPGWNFCHFFLLQEQLATVLDMLAVYDEALVQYDELDALFTQFVLNSHLTDTPQWLLSFQRHGDLWPALTLSSSDLENNLIILRERIRESSVSLLQFRNYLFARQAGLLIKQGCLPELASRALPFLHNALKELKILNVNFSEKGAIEAWAFVTGLEILNTITIAHPGSDFSVSSAGLWDYGREKLLELGKILGLVPGGTLSNDHLHHILTLTTGLCQGEVDNGLDKVLTTKETFKARYLELAELAMGAYKHIGRIRCARKVGISLAEFYLYDGEFGKSSGFLSDSLNTFKNDKWDNLGLFALLKLNDVYIKTGEFEKYSRNCAEIACSSEADEETRAKNFELFKDSLKNLKGTIEATGHELVKVTSLVVEKIGKISGANCHITVDVHLFSQLPLPFEGASLSIAIVEFEKEDKKDKKKKRSESIILRREIAPRLDMGQLLETRSDKTISGCRLLCNNSHETLLRKDSSAKIEPTRADFALAAKSGSFTLQPGNNVIKAEGNISLPGSFYLDQVSIQFSPNFEVLTERFGPIWRIDVERVSGKIILAESNPKNDLIAGIEQPLLLSIFTGSDAIEQDSKIEFRTSLGLSIATDAKEFGPQISVVLPYVEPFSSTDISIILKADLGHQKDSNPIEHKIFGLYPGTKEDIKIPLLFHPPFSSSHKLHSSGQRKFLQIYIHGLAEGPFLVSGHQLTCQNNKVFTLVPLMPRSQQLNLRSGQDISFVWEIDPDKDSEYPIRLEFSMTFSFGSGVENYRYFLALHDFRTLYDIQARVEPHKGFEFCRVGNMCSLVIQIEPQGISSTNAHPTLMYEVRADQHMWAICGRSSGVLNIEGKEIQQELDVMPMSAGFLPIPSIHLSKYIPADAKTSNIPKLEAFLTGQVFNRNRATQVHVLPPPQPPSSTVATGPSSLNSLGPLAIGDG